MVLLIEFKLAKIVPLLKTESLGFVQDDIRVISLTSNLIKLVERLLHSLLMHSKARPDWLPTSKLYFEGPHRHRQLY